VCFVVHILTRSAITLEVRRPAGAAASPAFIKKVFAIRAGTIGEKDLMIRYSEIMGRTAIPQTTADQLLFANRHRCCVCHEPRKPVQIHHIDGNPNNHAWDSLAVLCLDHHSDATGSQGFGRNYTPREIRLRKQNWEQQCQIWHETHDEDEDDDSDPEPMATLYKRLILTTDQIESYRFDLEQGDELVFNFSSDEPIDFLIMAQPEYELWFNDKDAEIEEEDERIMARHDSFEAPSNGWWAIVFHNPYAEPADLEYDIATWPGE